MTTITTNTNQGKENMQVHPGVAAVTGAVIGAGIAVAGAVAMKDEKNRAKVKEVFDTVKDEAVGYIDTMHKQANNQKDAIEGKLAQGKEKIEKKVSSVQEKQKEKQTK